MTNDKILEVLQIYNAGKTSIVAYKEIETQEALRLIRDNMHGIFILKAAEITTSNVTLQFEPFEPQQMFGVIKTEENNKE